MWVQQLNKIGLISLNKLSTLENVAGLLTTHVPRAVLDTCPDEATQNLQEYANVNQNHWNQKMATVERLPVFDDGENGSFEDDVHSFVDKTSHLTTAIFEGRRGEEVQTARSPTME